MILNLCCTENPFLFREAVILLFHTNFSKTLVCLFFYSLRQKKGNLAQKHWAGAANIAKCKPCPTAHSSAVCGSDGHTYSTKVSSARGLSSAQQGSAGMWDEDEIPLIIRQHEITLFVNIGMFFCVKSADKCRFFRIWQTASQNAKSHSCDFPDSCFSK